MTEVINNAFAETLFIIKCLPKKEQNKISSQFIKFLEENKNDNYKVNIDPNIDLCNQPLLNETKSLLSEIYRSYFISKPDREKILKHERYVRIIKEDIKKKKYNYENIFKNKNESNPIDSVENKNQNETVALVEYKKSFIKRLFDKIKKIIKKQ